MCIVGGEAGVGFGFQALRDAFTAEAKGQANIVPRTRWPFGGVRLNVSGAIGGWSAAPALLDPVALAAGMARG